MKNNHNKKKILVISIIIIIVLLVLLIIGIIFGFDFNKLMGNSLTNAYYYCEDSSFTLKGGYCYKTNYTEPVLMGDANKDGTISIFDVTEIQKYAKNMIEFDEVQLIVSDVNNDGVIDNYDATLLQKSISDLDKNYNTVGGTAGTFYTVGKDKFCPKNYHLIRNETTCSYKQVIKAKKEEFIYGDINSDKVIDEKDASLLQQYLSGLIDFTKVQKEAGDVNKDGIINVLDITALNDIIQKNNRASVSAEVLMLNKIDINNVVANTRIEYQAKFKVDNNKQYYYKWYDVKSPAKTLETECKLVTNNASDNYTIEATDNNEYVLLKLYSDKDCTNQINMYKSQEIKIKEEESTVSLDYKLLSPILTSNIVNKDTKLTFYAIFKVTGSKKYYYRWNAIKDNKVYNEPGCILIQDGMTRNPTLTINGKDQHGTWEIYSDASCKKESLVQTYSTDNYNYIADSISLNIKSTRLTTGNTLKLQASVKSNLSNVYSKIKWTSSNASVATVDNNGNVTAKKAGSVAITANVGGMSAKADITVVDAGNDTSIACPLIEYTTSGNNITMNISPGTSVKKYDIYLSNNGWNGSYANWTINSRGITSAKQITLNKNNTQQAKIVVYGINGTTRNCYSVPFDFYKSYTLSSTATCPNINYSYEKNGNIYTYKDGSSTVTSGVKLMTVNTNLNSNYQYSWYTSQKDGSYMLFKTYRTSTKSISPTVTGNYYMRNGLLIVTDNYGNSIRCYTKLINNYNFTKYTYGTTDVYIEKGYSSTNASAVKNKVSSFNSTNPQYLAVGKIFLLTNSSYNKVSPANSCAFINNRYITVRDNYSGCNAASSLTHELGHSIDYMNGYVTKKVNGTKYDIRDYTFNYNNKNTTISNYYNIYKNNSSKRNSYLRDYAYTNNEEFWAELFAYQEKGFKVDSTLKEIRTRALNKYTDLYKNNKSVWNSIKESYR